MRTANRIRIVRLLTLLLCLVLPSSGTAAFMTDLLGIVGKEQTGLTAEITISANTLHDLDSERTELLNRILKHIRFKIDLQDEGESVLILTDGNPAVSMAVREEATATDLFFPECSENSFRVSDPGSFLQDIFGDSPLKTMKRSASYSFPDFLDCAETMASSLNEDVSIERKEETVRQQIREVGRATRKISWSMDPEQMPEAFFNICLESLFGTGNSQYSYTGRQRFTIYQDEMENPLRIQYSGGLTDPKSQTRKASLDWKFGRSSERKYDYLVLKTPTAESSDRNNLIMERLAEDDQNGTKGYYSLKWQADTIQDRERKLENGETELFLDEQQRLTGQISYLVHGNALEESVRWVIKPDFSLQNRKEYNGTLEIINYSGKILQDDIVAQITVIPGGFLQFSDGKPVDWDLAGADYRMRLAEELRSALYRRMVQSMLTLPRDELGYILAGLADVFPNGGN